MSWGLGVYEIPVPFGDVSETGEYGCFSVTSLCGVCHGVSWPVALSDYIRTSGAAYGLVIWGIFCLFKTFGNWPLTRYLFFKVKSSCSVSLPLRRSGDSRAVAFAPRAGEASCPQGKLTRKDMESF